MKTLKIVCSWVIFLLGCVAILVFFGGIVAGLLALIAWAMDATLGYWCIPVAMVIAIACVVAFFWLNPIKDETLVKNKPNETYK